MIRNDSERYGVVAQALHWLIAVLIFTMFGLGYYMEDLPLGQQKLELYGLHKSLGITIFTLAVACSTPRRRYRRTCRPGSGAPPTRRTRCSTS